MHANFKRYFTNVLLYILPFSRFKAHIGYGLSHEYWGNGIATRAVSTAVSQVFNDLPHVLRLQAFVQTQNKASQRVLEKVGFEREGLLRKYTYLKGEVYDVFVFSLLSSDLLPLFHIPPQSKLSSSK